MSIQFLSKLIAIVIALLTLMLGQSAVSADILLREKIVPVRSVITLGDIADIHAPTTAERQRLAHTRLWIAPPVGEQRFVTVQQVREVLTSRGFEASSLNFTGATRVAVGSLTASASTNAKTQTDQAKSESVNSTMGFRTSLGSTGEHVSASASQRRSPIFLSGVQRDQLTDQVREAIVTFLETKSGNIGRIEVDFSLSNRHTDLLSLQTSDLDVSGGKAPWTGRQALIVTFESEKGPIRMPVSVEVFDTTPVLVAKRSVARGQILTAADVAIQSPSRDARVSRGKALVYSLDEVLGKEAARPLREGEVVTADLCLAPMMIQRNELVSIVSAGGGIIIRRRGKALSDARQGEVAEVELLDSKDRLAARVVGPGKLAALGSSSAVRTASNSAAHRQ